MRQRTHRLFSAAILLTLLPVAQSFGAGEKIAAVTNPSADVTLSFTQPGLIAKMHVKQGDVVESGQLLAQQDDAIERAQLAQIEEKSQNTSQVQASQASLDQKKVDLKKLERAAARDAATELEVEHARLEVKMAELSLEIAKLEHHQDQLKCQEARIRVEKMQLRSSIAGSVEKVEVEPGESTNALEDVVRVVQIDPLWTDIPALLATARTLKPGQRALVEFADAKATVLTGRVISVGAVADAASGTLLVRVEVPNEARRPAGEHVKVSFPPL